MKLTQTLLNLPARILSAPSVSGAAVSGGAVSGAALSVLVLALVCLSVLSAPATLADPLPQPQGPVILTVSGNLSQTNSESDNARFTLNMLDRLPQVTITTSTPWYDGPRKFTGPLARDLLEWVGADGEKLKATALNDYSIEIPLSDLQKYDVILATRLDGQTMSVREKGPIFVIYPFDDNPELVSEVFYQRCIWQLHKLTLE